ncbi:hypothetical protein EVJ58_g10530 [Rhodofomes roseus]|uniref:Uncharacterized protein n=1 Tax=Rhodofomes roseus TaxID=34475 RepID=A0A4Y9XN36_9APHY|nr:hypothetical protein EVJ58_g10530 [Rhodofomes roseus]
MDLAASDIETVNGLWKGLGYYSRAARLLSGAKKVVEQFDGRLPDNAKDLETHIPGIGSPVTSFPMKVVKKKSREELDIVNVIEWRHHADGERWFLLVRRPEGEQIEIPHTLLSGILAVPLPQYAARTSADQTYKASSSSEGSSTLRIVKVAPAGDVIHIFSHIKKTYRIQWVVLEGGSAEPPCLAPLSPPAPVGGPTKRAVNADGKKSSKVRKAPSKAGQPKALHSEAPVQAMWMPMDDVINANIGTGVLKVWNQTRKLWGDVS